MFSVVGSVVMVMVEVGGGGGGCGGGGGGWWFENEFSVHLWSEASANVWTKLNNFKSSFKDNSNYNF